MAEPAPAPRLDNPAVNHDRSDVDLRRITYWGAGLAAAVLLFLLLLFWLFDLFSARESKRGHHPVGIPKTAPPATAPQLQISPPTDMRQLRAAEDKILNSYGWVDKEKGAVRIPIERAMEITAQRGLPARKE
jgi:hypothetical protein